MYCKLSEKNDHRAYKYAYLSHYKELYHIVYRLDNHMVLTDYNHLSLIFPELGTFWFYAIPGKS